MRIVQLAEFLTIGVEAGKSEALRTCANAVAEGRSRSRSVFRVGRPFLGGRRPADAQKELI